MTVDTGAAGYQVKADGFFRPEIVAPKLMKSYWCDSIVPQLARTNFLSDENLTCNSVVHWAYLDAPDQQLDDQADYPMNGPSYEIDVQLQMRQSTICRSFRFHHKVDKRDKELMCTRWEIYEEALFERFRQQMHLRIDGHFFPTMIGSAALFNQGNTAGYVTQSQNLGSLTTPFAITSGAQAGLFVQNLLVVMNEVSLFCDPTNMKKNLGDGNGVVFVVDPITASWIRELFRVQIVQGTDGVVFTGAIPNPYGLKIYVSNRLPYAINGSAQRVQYIFAMDSSRVAFPMEVLYVNWIEYTHHWELGGDVIWDSLVFDPKAIFVGAVSH